MSDFVFPDHRTEGWFPVTDPRGRPVARIRAAWTGGRFSVTTPDDAPLCRGWATSAGLSGRWKVVGASDALALLTVRVALLRNRSTVQLERGPQLTLRGNAWLTGFTVTDADRRQVLTGEHRHHDYVVHAVDEALLLPESLALVQVWRMVRKAAIAASTVAVSSAVVAGS
jgi:hypothetical protein